MNVTLQTILGIMAPSADESAKIEMAEQLIQEEFTTLPLQQLASDNNGGC